MTILPNCTSREISNPKLHKESTKVLISLTKMLHKSALNLQSQPLYKTWFIWKKILNRRQYWGLHSSLLLMLRNNLCNFIEACLSQTMILKSSFYNLVFSYNGCGFGKSTDKSYALIAMEILNHHQQKCRYRMWNHLVPVEHSKMQASH